MFDVRSPWLGRRLAQGVCAVTGRDPGAVARQPIRAELAAQLSGPLSRAPLCWRKYPEPCGREANQEKPSAEWAGGLEAGPRPLAAPSSSPRLLPQPLCLHTSIHSSYTPHPPKLTTNTCPLLPRRQTAKQMYASARRRRTPTSRAQKHSHLGTTLLPPTERKPCTPHPHFHKLARVPNMVPSTFPPRSGLKEINDPLGRAV